MSELFEGSKEYNYWLERRCYSVVRSTIRSADIVRRSYALRNTRIVLYSKSWDLECGSGASNISTIQPPLLD